MASKWCTLYLHNPRVLIIDDDQEFAEMLAQLYREGGAQVQVAHDGAAGLVAVRRFEPDLVLCDFNMPFLTGDKVLIELRKIGFRQPFILLTGYSDMRIVSEALQLNVFDFLSKPVPREVLIAVSQKAFRQEFDRLLLEEELNQAYLALSETPPPGDGMSWKEVIVERTLAEFREKRTARSSPPEAASPPGDAGMSSALDE